MVKRVGGSVVICRSRVWLAYSGVKYLFVGHGQFWIGVVGGWFVRKIGKSGKGEGRGGTRVGFVCVLSYCCIVDR